MLFPVLATLLISQATLPASAPVRAHIPPSEKAKSLLTLGARIGAKNTKIERPETLETFFLALDGLVTRTRTDHVHIVTFGNSLISADNVTNVVRERLVERFGDGGRGLVLTDRIADYGNRLRSGYAPKGAWLSYNLAMGPKGRGVFGLSGVIHEAAGYATTEWRLNGETEAELFYLDHKDTRSFSLKIDGAPFMQIEPLKDGGGKALHFTLPATAKRLQLTASRGNVTIFGLTLEKPSPGIVFDTIGIPAAEAASYLIAKEDIAQAQLKSRRPTLLMFMLGGNEIRRLSWARANSVAQRKEQLEQEFRALIERMQAAAPDAACLAVGPIDAVYGQSSPMKLKTRPQVDDLNAIERKVAEEKGCAYYDLYAAMGGKGSLEKFSKNAMLHDDLVHPKGRGLDLLGELLAQAIMQAYADTVPTKLAQKP